jgi:chemotaxis response regulator CheB
MNVLIVEDEEVVSRRLARLTRAILGPRLQSLEIAATVSEALGRLRERALDLVFLDLDLHGDDGFRVLREAVAGAFQTIIVSGRTPTRRSAPSSTALPTSWSSRTARIAFVGRSAASISESRPCETSCVCSQCDATARSVCWRSIPSYAWPPPTTTPSSTARTA